MHIKSVGISDYLTTNFEVPVYCKIDVLEYNKRKDGQVLTNRDFYNNPSDYESDFMRFAAVTDYFIAGHYYDKNAPNLITLEDVNLDDFKIKLIADISCDINGPIVCTIRSSTIKDPIYGYDPISNKEVDYNQPGAISN